MRKRPFGFIGSSSEGLPVAKAIQANLDRVAECMIWCQGGFGLGEGTLESLVEKLDDLDFAVLVLTPDDFLESRGARQAVPRDNVLLELGLFIGRLGLARTYVVVDRSAKLKLPSDLAGVTPATYQPPESGPLQAALGAACTAIEEAVGKVGRRRKASIRVRGGVYRSADLSEGLQLTVLNEGADVLPPYQICLYSPRRGSIFFFPSKESGALLPEQRREHLARLLISEGRAAPFPNLRGTGSGAPAVSDFDDFSFRLVLEHSDRVLYENPRLGRSVAWVASKILLEKTCNGVNGLEMANVHSREDDEIGP